MSAKKKPIYDMEADVEFAETDPSEWRNLPEPEGDDRDDDEDGPTPKYVVEVLGFDPDELDDDYKTDDD